MIRHRCNRIPHRAIEIQQERNTNAEEGIKYNRTQAENQADSSFPACVHQAVIEKVDKTSRANGKSDKQ